MSLELKYKRSLPTEPSKSTSNVSKSVTNAKKGILKKSSSLISSGKKKPVSFKGSKKIVPDTTLKSKIANYTKSNSNPDSYFKNSTNKGKASEQYLKKGNSLFNRMEEREDLPKFQ